MKTIDLSSIDFSKVDLLKDVVSSESNLYVDNETLIKIYKNLYYSELINKGKKMEALNDRSKLPNVIIPDVKIVSADEVVVGCSMPYKKNTIPLYDFKQRCSSCSMYFGIVKQVSNTTKAIHSSEIIVADLNFDNIIFDETMSHYFVDFDSCAIDGIMWERISLLLHDFLIYKNIRITKDDVNKNMDRLSLILSFLCVIFDMPIQFVSIRTYDELAEKISTLKNIRRIVLDLLSKNKRISEIPYIGDCIDTNNDYQFKPLK